MSSTLYSSEISEDDYGSLIIEMHVNGHLRLVIQNRDHECASFYLSPSNECIKEMENIITVLNGWSAIAAIILETHTKMLPTKTG